MNWQPSLYKKISSPCSSLDKRWCSVLLLSPCCWTRGFLWTVLLNWWPCCVPNITEFSRSNQALKWLTDQHARVGNFSSQEWTLLHFLGISVLCTIFPTSTQARGAHNGGGVDRNTHLFSFMIYFRHWWILKTSKLWRKQSWTNQDMFYIFDSL